MQSEDEQKAIEAEFSKSWDGIERFFVDYSVNLPWLTPIQTLIAELRKRGYDRQFRAGQAMVEFILSRSREHGLESGQSRIWFDIHPKGRMRITYIEADQKVNEFDVEQVAITPEIEALLERLLAQPID